MPADLWLRDFCGQTHHNDVSNIRKRRESPRNHFGERRILSGILLLISGINNSQIPQL